MKKLIARIGNSDHSVEIPETSGQVVINGREHRAELAKIYEDLYSLILGTTSYELHIRQDGKKYRVLIEGHDIEVSLEDSRLAFIRRTGGTGDKKSLAEVKASMPGLVTTVRVTRGTRVEAGTGLLTLEAMKMENEIRSPINGVVAEVLANPGKPVERGDLLVRLST